MVMPEDGTISLGYTLIVVVINSRQIAMIKKQKKGRQSSVVRINGGACCKIGQNNKTRG